MDNQQPLQQPQQFQQPNLNPPVSYNSGQSKSHKKRRMFIIGTLLTLLLLILGGGAYGYFVYMPNKPEMVLKKSLEKFQDEPGQYAISGRIDQGGPNAPDFDYTLELDGRNAAKASINAQTFLANPTVEVAITGGKTYFKAGSFYNRAELAGRYTNLGPKGIQEYMAEFAEYSGIHGNQGKWIEVPSYLFGGPSSGGVLGESTDEPSQLVSIGEVVEKDGKKLQKFVVSTTVDELLKQLGNLGDSQVFGNASNMARSFGGGLDGSTKIELNVWVNTSQKLVDRIEYSGRPFKDATFSMNLQRQPVTVAVEQPAVLTSTLSYGIAWSELVRKDMQSASSESDKERIADMKGIKLAMEIYKAKNGVYPDRYSIAVEQQDFLNSNLPHVDHQLFIDPAGRRIGLNGSQYAYVPSTADGNESCGPHNGPKCEKFFIVTTLDNGAEYQLNSD